MATLKVGSLGEYIREQRESAQVSLRQLARTAGVSNPYLSQIERGVKKPSAEILSQIAKGLRISAETLYVQAGILDERDSSDVVAAVLADPTIGERHKRVLLDVYESFRAEHAADVKAARQEGSSQEAHCHQDHHEVHQEEEFMMSLTTITRSKPFYVAAGATDLAVKTLRQAPSRIPSVKVERRDLEKAVANVSLQAATLPARAQATAVGIADEVSGRADAVYGDLLVRGRKVVGRIRRQKATQDLKKDATTTVRRSKATATTAKKSAAATGSTAKKASKRTSTTAKKRATTTRTAAKGATTSARKTTTSAAKATTAGAAKVGS